MSKSIWRFKLMENKTDNTPLKWFDCDEYEELNQVSLVIEGKKTSDSHLEICAVGNIIQFKSEKEIYKVESVLTQNGSLETHIDITCVKIK